MNETTLIATLGGQPQIITFTLDLLLQRAEKIDQVVLVYPSPNARYTEAHRRLMTEFVADQYNGLPCHLRAIPMRLTDASADISNPRDVEIVHQTFHQLLGDLKSQGHTLHLSLSGGRRIIALIALEAAMRYLSPNDRIWHIYTTPELTEQARDGKMMHAPPEGGVQLMPVPFVPWAAYFPGLRPLLDRSPQEQREADAGWLSDSDRELCAEVWQQLTLRQREVLRLLASGCSRAQAAGQLHVAPSTIDTHRSVIIQHCTSIWGGSEYEVIGTQFLRQRFGPFLRGLDQV